MNHLPVGALPGAPQLLNDPAAQAIAAQAFGPHQLLASLQAQGLAQYTELAWVPTWNGGTVTITASNAVKIGRLVFISADITFGASASASASTLTLPVNQLTTYGFGGINFTDVSATLSVNVTGNAVSFRSAINATNVACSTVAGKRVIFFGIYMAAN